MIELAEAAMSLVGVLAVQRPGEVVLPCRAVMLDADGVRGLQAEAWDDLAAGALEDNPWLSRQMVLAGLDAYGAERNFHALALYPHGSDRLIGFTPFKTIGLGPISVGTPALNLYQVGGTPLIARDCAQMAMTTLLGLISDGKGLPRHWLFPHVREDGPFMTLARHTAGQMGMRAGLATPYQRAVLTREAGDFAAHIAQVIGKKRAKDIERNLRRLGKDGEVTFERVTEPQAVAARVEDFLALEAAGWKGKRGTALLSCSRDAQFARRAFGGVGAAEGLALVDSLLLDGRPIAISINVATGKTLYTPKCAFDEKYRKFGPGMMLEYKVIEAFFAEEAHREMDAATTVDGHVISGLWGQTITMGTGVIGPDGTSTHAVVNGLDGYGAVKKTLKRWLKRD